MKDKDQEQQFLDFVKRTLDQSIEDLDSHTTARLRSTRQTVLSGSSKTISWVQPAWAIAATCIVVFTFTLWESDPPQLTSTLPLENMELLASAEEWDLYEELEFYTWLEENDPTG